MARTDNVDSSQMNVVADVLDRLAETLEPDADSPVEDGTSSLRRRLHYHSTEYRSLSASAPSDPLPRMVLPIHGRVLDVGCGFGQVLYSVCQRGNPDVMIGVDVDRDLLGIGEKISRSATGSIHLPRFVAADALRLPFGDRTFDLVICRVVLMSLSVRPAIQELARMVAPGGRLYLHLTGPGYYLEDFARGQRKGSFFALVNGLLLALFSTQVSISGLWNNFQTSGRIEKLLAAERLTVREVSTGPRCMGLPVNEKVLAERTIDRRDEEKRDR